MYQDENMASSLAKLFSQFDYTMIDTCSLMEDSFPKMLDALTNAVKSGYLDKSHPVYVHARCYDELKKHAKKKKLDKFAKHYEIEAMVNRMIAAKRAIKIIKHAKHAKVLFIYKDKNKNFADNVIYTKASQDRIGKSVLVVTQDKKLAWDINGLNMLASQKGKRVSVMKLLPDGNLLVNKGEKPNPNEQYRPKENNFKAKNKPNKLLDIIKEEDGKLKANLTNPTFPKEKAKAAILAQLDRLKSLDDKQVAELHLCFDASTLKEKLPKENKMVVSPAKPVVTAKPVAPKKEVAKETLVPAKKVTPLDNKPHSEGMTIEDAIRKCAAKLGVLVRDPSVPFIKGVHGDFDITNNDIYDLVEAFISKIKVEKRPSIEKKDYVVSCSRIEKSLYYCWIEQKIEAKPALDASVEVKATSKPASKKKAKKKEANKDSASSSKESKKEPAKKKATSSKKKVAVKKEESKPVKEKSETVAKKASKPKTVKPSIVVKEGVSAKKSETKAPKKEISFDEVTASDKKLKANISNPNYSKENKIKDVKAQIKLVKKLKAEDAAKLSLSLENLNKFLEENK